MRAPFVGNNPKYFREWIFSFFIFNQSTRRAPYRFKQIPQTLEKPFTDVWRNALVRNGSTKPERSGARRAAQREPRRRENARLPFITCFCHAVCATRKIIIQGRSFMPFHASFIHRASRLVEKKACRYRCLPSGNYRALLARAFHNACEKP